MAGFGRAGQKVGPVSVWGDGQCQVSVWGDVSRDYYQFTIPAHRLSEARIPTTFGMSKFLSFWGLVVTVDGGVQGDRQNDLIRLLTV